MKDFTQGSIPKNMLMFLVPLLLSNMLQAIYILIDAVWAGRILGPDGVAIVSTGTPVIFLLTSVLGGIGVGASILAGQAFGSKNFEELSNILSTSLLAGTIASVALSALGIAFVWPIIHMINTPPSLQAGTHVFLVIITAGMTLGSSVQWFASMLNAAGDSKTPFRVLIISLAINLALAPLLIGGWKFIPALGIAGSALSTMTANLVSVAICIFVWRRHRLFKLAPLRLKMRADTLKSIIAVGFPLALQLIVVSGSFLFILSLVNKFGPQVTAAFGIGNRVDQFALLATFAIATAISAMTAQHVGAGKLERIPEIARWGLIYSVGISLFFFALVVAFTTPITALFTRDTALVPLTRGYFLIVGASYVAFSINFAYQGILRGAGDTLGSFFLIAFSMIVFRVPLCYLLSHRNMFGIDGLWLGITVSAFVGSVGFYLYYRSGWWKKRGTRVLPQEPEDMISSGMETEAL